jgi:hypothetical protein
MRVTVDSVRRWAVGLCVQGNDVLAGRLGEVELGAGRIRNFVPNFGIEDRRDGDGVVGLFRSRRP